MEIKKVLRSNIIMKHFSETTEAENYSNCHYSTGFVTGILKHGYSKNGIVADGKSKSNNYSNIFMKQ